MHKPLPLILALAALAATAALAGCGASNSAKPPAVFPTSSAASAARSILAVPAVSADLSTAEAELLANVQKEYQATPAHPFQAVSRAIHDTWPQGNTTVISQYAVSTFTLAVLHTHGAGSARDNWLQGVVAKAEGQGYTPPASPGAGAVPGASPSASKS